LTWTAGLHRLELDQDAAKRTTVTSMAGLHRLERWGWRVTAWAQVVVTPRADVSVIDVPAACDRVFLQIAAARHLRQLRHGAIELRFISFHAERLVEATREEYGSSREIGVAQRSFAVEDGSSELV
jgi:hypothetical protein